METNSFAEGGEYKYLGNRTLWIFVLQRSQPAFIILLLSVFVFIISMLDVAKDLSAILYQSVVIGVVLFLLASAAAFTMGWLTYANYRFLFDENALKIKKGILSKEEIAIPYRQIQDITIERNLSLQMMGASRLLISTAGHEDKPEEGGVEGVLPEIDKTLAEKLRDELLKRAEMQRMVTTQAG